MAASRGGRVAVALSGGVDSAMAAALLREWGYAVEGLTMRVWRDGDSGAADPAPAAEAVCQHLGIAWHLCDARDVFYREVVAPFVAEYARGRTPNPCLRCNRVLKFGWLWQQARALGCSHLATGHYARVRRVGGAWRLLAGIDATKDQSYFLYALGQAELGRLLLPLGELHKDEVRALARERGLPVAERAESQDICFLPAGDYRALVARLAPEAVRPGPIYHLDGRLLGEHRGLPYYTVGQREGLGISAPRPLYVLRLDAARNALVVAEAEALGRTALEAEEMRYVAGRPPSAGEAVEVKIRYRAPRCPARVYPRGGARARIALERALRDVTPGQGIVLYQGEYVLGGGVIAHAAESTETRG